DLAPQHLSAIATMRPNSNHQVTASIGYGQVALARKSAPEFDLLDSPGWPTTVRANRLSPLNAAPNVNAPRSLDQVSVSAVDEWQVFQPLLVIYGFDYSRFISSAAAQQESVLPRIAVQYNPSAKWRMSAAVTPRTSQTSATENFSTENINAPF